MHTASVPHTLPPPRWPLCPGDLHRNSPPAPRIRDGTVLAGSCAHTYTLKVLWGIRALASMNDQLANRVYLALVGLCCITFKNLLFFFIFHINVRRSPCFQRPRLNNSTTCSSKSLNAPWPWSCRHPPASPWRQSRAASRQSGRAMPHRRWGALRRNARLLPWCILQWTEEPLSVYNNSSRLRGVHWPSGFQVLKTTEVRKS